MKKLLYITTNLDSSGGVSRVLSVKLNYFVKNFGYDISVISTNGDSKNLFYQFDEKIKIFSLEQSKSKLENIFTYRRKLNEMVRSINPDITINCDNGFKGALLPYLLNFKTKLIYERHCSKNIGVRGFYRRFKLKASNIVLDTSSDKYEAFVVLNVEEKQDWNYKKIEIISNPLAFQNPIKKADLNKKTVIAVGRISHEKGYDKLLNIWKIVAKEYPEWVLKIYGEGNNSKLKKAANSQKTLGNIEFHGPIKNIEEVYSNASMLLNTSRSEAFGMSIIEAMSFGLPVIAFNNTSGAKNSIVNRENGFVIEKNNIEAYAQKIKLLIKSEDERQRIGSNARDIIKNYNLDIIMKQWHELFQSIY